MRRRLLAVVLGCLVLSVGLVACGGDDSKAPADAAPANEGASNNASPSGEPIVIGAAVAKTGFFEISDLPPLQGLEVAIDDINKNGGVLGRPLKLVTVDTKSDRAQGAAAALQTLDQGAVIGVVSCDLDLGAPAAIEFAKKNMVSFSLCAGSPTYGPKGVSPFAFSAGQATPSEAAGSAHFASVNKQYKTAYVLKDTLLDYSMSWGSEFDRAFKAYGGQIVGGDTYNNNDTSIQTQAARLKKLNPAPDVIAMCGVQPGGPAAVRQLRSSGINSPIVMCNGLDGANWLPSVPGLKDAFVVSYGSFTGDDSDDRVNEFFKKYIDRFDAPNNGHALQGYGLAEILVEGVKQADTTDGPAVQAALEQLTDFKPITGCTTYDKDWHVSFCRPTAFKEIKDGKAVFVDRVEPEADKVAKPE